MLALLGACLASVPARPTAQAAGLLPEQETALLQQLAAADRQWLPRAETLPSGAVRYHYRRRANEPKLSVAELRALIVNPPSFGAERLAIGELLTVLAKAGVRLELSQPRKPGASGEWDPAARTLRIQPRVVAKGRGSLPGCSTMRRFTLPRAAATGDCVPAPAPWVCPRPCPIT